MKIKSVEWSYFPKEWVFFKIDRRQCDGFYWLFIEFGPWMCAIERE